MICNELAAKSKTTAAGVTHLFLEKFRFRETKLS